MDAAEIIDTLGLVPHPEGGWYRETWRAPADQGGRSAGTSIYYLLTAGEFSHWHRIDAVETWHHYAGDALELWLSPEGEQRELHVLGTELVAGERPQIEVPAGTWQAANPRGAYALVGCTVVPGFEFDGFDVAPAGWQPGPES
jgi:predicted cupin superfamily sugar epimerase